MESHENKDSSTKKNTGKIGRWFVIWIITIIIVFGTALAAADYLRNFWNSQQAIQKLEIERVTIEQRNLSQQKSRVITKERLKSAMSKLQPKLDPDLSDKIASSVLAECKAKCLDPALVVGIINVESEFNPFAESKKGATGLMQIRYVVWEEEPELINNGVNQKAALFWIDRNIKAGTAILKKYYEEADCDMVKALYRYNSGSSKLPKGTSRWDLRYVNKVIYYTYVVKMHLTDDNRCEPETELEEIK